MNRQELATMDARRIIVFRALFVGDLLCAVPAFRALRRRFPGAEIVLVGLPWARDFVARMPYLDRLLPSPGFPGLPEVAYDSARTDAFYARVRREAYDLAIQLHGSGRSTNAMVAAFGAWATIGFSIEGDERVTATVPWIEEENEVLRCLRPLALVGAETSDVQIEFPMSIDEKHAARTLLGALPASRGPIVGLHAGAKDPRRRWPAERFAALGDALGVRYRARIVLTGGPDDRALGTAIQRAMRVPSLDLTGRTDLGTFGALISRLDLLVTNDTGASHLAAATRTPSVVLFGFARPERWAPLNRDLHTVIDAVTIGGVTRDPATALSELPLVPVLAACNRVLGRSGSERLGVRAANRPVAPGITLERVWGG